MANVLPREKQLMALHMLADGSSLRTVTRITGIHRTTLQNLLVRFGTQCDALMENRLRDLRLEHIEVDEMWTFVRKKQGKLSAAEKKNAEIGDQYLWFGVDQKTKLVPAFLVGKRSADNALRFMQQIRERVSLPTPFESDDHHWNRTGYVPQLQISSDAFAGYSEAVDLTFGPYVKYGQLVKDYSHTEQTVRYGPSKMVDLERRPIRGIEDPATICTSHVERSNLTVRTFVRRFTRLSLSFSKKLENLQAACAMHFAYYNFCWRPRYEDRSGRSGRHKPTPAMMAGVLDRLWSFEDLYDAAIAT